MALLTAGIRGVLAGLFVLSLGAGMIAATAAQTPEASPAAIPMPQGPLGEQMTWVIDNLNAKSFDAADLEAHVGPELLERAPADQLAATLLQIAGIGPFTLEPASLVSTRDLPPTNARFILAGQGGIRLAVSITVDRESGLITDLLFEPADPRPQITPVGTLREPVPDREATPGSEVTPTPAPDDAGAGPIRANLA